MTEIKQYEPLWGVWHVDSLIGEGSCGKVYKLRREEFGKTYYSAVKLISIPKDESEVKHLRSSCKKTLCQKIIYDIFGRKGM